MSKAESRSVEIERHWVLMVARAVLSAVSFALEQVGGVSAEVGTAGFQEGNGSVCSSSDF